MVPMTSRTTGPSVGGSVPRPRLVAAVGGDCTGCYACVDYCLVDCIEPAPQNSSLTSPAPILVREDECIGCFVCAKVCDALDVHAIRLIPAAPVP